MELTLDIAKWRCGRVYAGLGGVAVGEGPSQLLNDEGYQCCVGQFAEQCGIPLSDLKGYSVLEAMSYTKLTPAIKEVFKRPMTYDINLEYGYELPVDNVLYGINDDVLTTLTVRQKIQAIRDVLAKSGHTLRVINEHLIPDEQATYEPVPS